MRKKEEDARARPDIREHEQRCAMYGLRRVGRTEGVCDVQRDVQRDVRRHCKESEREDANGLNGVI